MKIFLKFSSNCLDLIGKYGCFNHLSTPSHFDKTKTSVFDHILIKIIERTLRLSPKIIKMADHFASLCALPFQHSDNNKFSSTNATFQKIDNQLRGSYRLI